MRLLKILLTLLITITIAGCKQPVVSIDVDCAVTPTHEECIEEPVDCDVTPAHEECVVEPVDCDVTPAHEECVVEPVDCEVTPTHEECIVEPVDCDVTPAHEECVVEPVDCDVTPAHIDCTIVEPVDCDTTPLHEDCTLDDENDTCEIKGMIDCKFTLSLANSDGSFTTVSTYEILSAADTALDESDNDDYVIIFDDKVIDMKYGLINFKTKSVYETTNIYPVGTWYKTYVNGNYNVEGLFLENDAFITRGIVAGVEFTINTSEIELIPHVQTNNMYSFYFIRNGELIHHIVQDIGYQSYWSIGAFDKAPTYLEEDENYYSYDGHYFFKDIKKMTLNYNLGISVHAVNKNEPYYNYYQYLSFRSKTNYTGLELSEYINSKVSTSNVMYDSGPEFIAAQNDMYVNAAMEIAFAAHESGWGTSQIANSKLNLFGMNAVDSDPFNEATGFSSIADCVRYHAKYYLQFRYMNPTNWVSHGTNLGNKYQGMNYKYASDAYWGEKIAKHYYTLDKELGFKDYDSQKIVIVKAGSLGYIEPNVSSTIIYDGTEVTYDKLDVPFVMIGETDDFYILQLPLGLDENNVMSIDIMMDTDDIFYLPKANGTLVN